MPTFTESWSDVTDGILLFSNISVHEVDVGATLSFVDTGGQPTALAGADMGLQWGGFTALVTGAGSSQTLMFDYDVGSLDSGEMISTIDSLYVVDNVLGAGAHLTATANVYDLDGNLVASQTYSHGGPIPNAVSFIQAQAGVHVTLTITAWTDNGDSLIDLSAIRQSFRTTAITELCSIGDYVWLDLDADGLQSSVSAPPGISGVTVNLMDATGTNVLATTVTNGTGFYLFDNLLAGTYVIQFVSPSGLAFSAQDVGGDDSIDSDADVTTGKTAAITLEAGDHVREVDAGLNNDGSGSGATAALGNYVWVDTNGNGAQDEVGTGLSGVTVNLLNSTGVTVIGTTTTGSLGEYAFTNLEAGTYYVQFVGPSGHVFTGADQTADASDSDANTTTGLSHAITLAAGQIDATIDAGVILATAELGNYVWVDTNQNGEQDETGTGMAGVTVNLLSEAGVLIATDVTDSNGFYLFSGLLAGTYQVEFYLPDEYLFTTADTGLTDASDSDANPLSGLSAVITLAAGESNLTIDAGLIHNPPALAAIGNYVWYDCDSDGIQDAGESGLSGVSVQLRDATGTTTLATTTTDSTGFYEFTGLSAGTYQVHFGTKSGYGLTAANIGINDAIDSDANTTSRLSGPVTLSAGEVDHTVDAGMVLVCPASLGNYVWYDCDKDGVQDYGESGLSGVTVQLRDATGTTTLATTTTSASGYYQFTGLSAGTYQVHFGTKLGYELTTANAGTNDAVDSDANTTTRLSGPIVLSWGENDTSIDAGMKQVPVDCGPRMGGLTPGFWSTHLKAWDGAADTKYANLVNSGVLSALDVLRALPNQGNSGPGGALGVLLGDSNANGVTDAGEVTLFVGLTAAQQIISSSQSATDTR